MRVALAVNLVTADATENLDRMAAMVAEAAEAGADLVLFPEAAVTGLINNDDPAHDLPLGVPVPGATTKRLAAPGQAGRLTGASPESAPATPAATAPYVGVGLFERAGDSLYDSAVLLAPSGEVVLHYRRNSRGWRHPRADQAVYKEGTAVPLVHTLLGSFMFLICGDLFDDGLVARVREAKPDFLLFPFARSFDGPGDQARWDREEMPEYIDRVKLAGCTTLMVNYISAPGGDDYFGGAWVVRGDGAVTHNLPLGRPGLLIADVATGASIGG